MTAVKRRIESTKFNALAAEWSERVDESRAACVLLLLYCRDPAYIHTWGGGGVREDICVLYTEELNSTKTNIHVSIMYMYTGELNSANKQNSHYDIEPLIYCRDPAYIQAWERGQLEGVELNSIHVIIQPIPIGVSFSKAQSSKLESLFCHVSVKRDVRALSFEL